jgi:hypothetical protein
LFIVYLHLLEYKFQDYRMFVFFVLCCICKMYPKVVPDKKQLLGIIN